MAKMVEYMGSYIFIWDGGDRIHVYYDDRWHMGLLTDHPVYSPIAYIRAPHGPWVAESPTPWEQMKSICQAFIYENI